MAKEPAHADEDISYEEFMRINMARRGEVMPWVQVIAKANTKAVTINQRLTGYVHQYDGMATGEQVLSVQMRELIATCQLAAKGDSQFATNHVRRMWKMGVTNKAIFEAALAMMPATGWSTIPHVALSVVKAEEHVQKEGGTPESGEPASIKPFPELSQGRSKVGKFDDGLLSDPDWADIAAIEPEYASRAARIIDYALLANGPGENDLLGPGPRELICIAGLCGRVMPDQAARHVRRAYAWGMSKRQVFEAISCITPMSGISAVQIGMRAIRMAGE